MFSVAGAGNAEEVLKFIDYSDRGNKITLSSGNMKLSPNKIFNADIFLIIFSLGYFFLYSCEKDCLVSKQIKMLEVKSLSPVLRIIETPGVRGLFADVYTSWL